MLKSYRLYRFQQYSVHVLIVFYIKFLLSVLIRQLPVMAPLPETVRTSHWWVAGDD